MCDRQRYTVRYCAGTYEGTRIVWAEDGEHALAKVRAEVRREMTLPMYSDGYRIVKTEEPADV